MYQEVFSPSADPAAVRDAAARLAEQLARHDAFETELQQVGVSPHAPYTVSDPLFALVARSRPPHRGAHCGERCRAALRGDGEGPFADAHRARGISVAPRASSPIALLDKLGVLDAHPLLIHCVRVSERGHCRDRREREQRRALPDLERQARSRHRAAARDARRRHCGGTRAPTRWPRTTGCTCSRNRAPRCSRSACRASRPDALSARRALELATLGRCARARTRGSRRLARGREGGRPRGLRSLDARGQRGCRSRGRAGVRARRRAREVRRGGRNREGVELGAAQRGSRAACARRGNVRQRFASESID